MRTRAKVSLYLVLAAGTVLACDARATPLGAVVPAAAPRTDALRPERLARLDESATTRARRALEAGDAVASRLVAEAALETANADDAPRLRMLAGLAAAAGGDAAGAASHFAWFEDASTHPLALWAKLARATALEPTDPVTALRLASELSVVEFPGASRARRIEARTRLATGDSVGATATLRLLAASSSGDAFAEVAVPLSAALVAAGDPASLREALELAHRLYAKAPRTSAGRSAESQMVELARRLGTAGQALRTPTLAERIERADGLTYARSDDAIAAYDEALEALPEGDPRICTLRLARARIIERGRDRRRTVAELTSLADRCEGDELRGWSLFKAARALQQLGSDDDALAMYARLERDAPGSRFADDGALYAARMHGVAGRTEAMRTALASLVEHYPSGDMRADAWFYWAWSLRKEGQFDDALALLRASRLAIAVEPGEENAGRAAYWEARTLARLGRAPEAIAAYELLARTMSLTYYGMSALSRLDELAPERAVGVRASLHTDAEPAEIPVDTSIDVTAFSRASELLIVGQLEDATAELVALGLVGDSVPDDKLFVAASLYVAADHPNAAVDLVRRRLSSARTLRPTAIARARLRLGYPRAFDPLIDEAAAAASLPPAFVRAIAREESSFNPNAVSRANAFGLIQILVPTARGYARDVGVEPTPQNLRDASTNLAFGTRFMARLFRRFEANPALVPAAYNAGHGSVERWLREDRQRPFDEFAEEIPYEETRRYTRRVLQSYGIYSLLDTGALPMFGSALPPE